VNKIPATLKRYRIDRAKGITSHGAVEVVALVLVTADGAEHAYTISKADAYLIAHQLQGAAKEAQAV